MAALREVRTIHLFVLKVLISFSANKSPTLDKSPAPGQEGAEVEGKHWQALVLPEVLSWTFSGASKKRPAVAEDDEGSKRMRRDTSTLHEEKRPEQNLDMTDTQGIVPLPQLRLFWLTCLSQSPHPILMIFLLPVLGTASHICTHTCLLKNPRNTSFPLSMMKESLLKLASTSFKLPSNCSMLVEVLVA